MLLGVANSILHKVQSAAQVKGKVIKSFHLDKRFIMQEYIYTETAREVMQASYTLAEDESNWWNVHHVAIALFEQPPECVTDILQSVGVDPKRASECLRQIKDQARKVLYPVYHYDEPCMTFYSDSIINFLKKIQGEANQLNSVVTPGHLLLVLTDPQYAHDIAPILARFGITKEAVEKALG